MNLGWVDYSKKEKDTIEELLKRLGEEGSLDELGVGIVRDSISELLYPGTSVLHTRAKYYILIPELFDKAKRSGLTSTNEVRRLISSDQDKIAKALKENSNSTGVKEFGIIGGRNYSVKMKPSRIYWNALRVSKILVDENLSFDDACSRVAAHNNKIENIIFKTEEKDSGSDDYDAEVGNLIIFNTPCKEKIEDFLKKPTLLLSSDEANYLSNQFLNNPVMKDTLMEYCLANDTCFKDLSLNDSFKTDFSNRLKNTMNLAIEFADFIYGAYIVYNIVYFENGGNNSTDKERMSLEREYEIWKKANIGLPHLDEILNLVHGHENYVRKIRVFLREFEKALKNNHTYSCSDEEKNVIVKREKICKLSKSKLRNKNYAYQRVHPSRMSYRHETAQIIISDILDGKERK